MGCQILNSSPAEALVFVRPPRNHRLGSIDVTGIAGAFSCVWKECSSFHSPLPRKSYSLPGNNDVSTFLPDVKAPPGTFD